MILYIFTWTADLCKTMYLLIVHLFTVYVEKEYKNTFQKTFWHI